jgi:hypothetical protein
MKKQTTENSDTLVTVTNPSSNDPQVESTMNVHMRKLLNYTVVVATIFFVYKAGVIGYNKKLEYDTAKKVAACPTLLSIARSARDTLLVMRAESLCTDYVLDDIQ